LFLAIIKVFGGWILVRILLGVFLILIRNLLRWRVFDEGSGGGRV
jgi:hypothetical protein